MKSDESLASFLWRAMTIASQMRSYREKATNQVIVEKVLRSLNWKFDYVFVTIELSEDLPVISFDEMMGYLQAHVARINQSLDKNEENSFKVKDATTKY